MDIERDGDVDLLVQCRNGEWDLLLQQDRKLESAGALLPDMQGSITALHVLNTSGRPALLIERDAGQYPQIVAPLENSGEALAFAAPTALPTATPSARLVVADINGDGFDDILSLTDASAFWLFGDATGGFRSGPSMPDELAGISDADQLLPADVDGDQRSDILWHRADGSVYLYRNDGLGNFDGEKPRLLVRSREGASLVVVGDLNADDRDDVLVSTIHGSFWLDALGGSRHALSSHDALKARRGSGLITDIDADGDGDVLLSGAPATLPGDSADARPLLLVGDAANADALQPVTDTPLREAPATALALVDVDQNGLDDVALATERGIVVYRQSIFYGMQPRFVRLSTNVDMTPSLSGANATLEVQVTGGSAVSFTWDFGDGQTATTTGPSVDHVYAAPGRYTVSVTARSTTATDTVTFTQIVTDAPAARRPMHSSDIAYETRGGDNRVYVVNPDQDTVSVINARTNARIAEIGVGDEPAAVALDRFNRLWVTNKGDATITLINTGTLNVAQTLTGPIGSRPHGIVIDNVADRAYVVLEAAGQLAEINSSTGALARLVDIGEHPRDVTLDPNRNLLYLPRFITSPLGGESGRNVSRGGGEIQIFNRGSLARAGSIAVPFNEAQSGTDSNTSSRGVPNYLRSFAVAPSGIGGVIPAKLDNIHRGSMRDGRRRRHNMLVRGMLGVVHLDQQREILPARLQYVNNSRPTAATYGPLGAFIYAVHQGSRSYEVIDAATGQIIAASSVGFAPTGVVAADDGNRVYVHNWLSRSVSVIDTSGLMAGRNTNAPVIATIDTTAREALSSRILLGKRLFHDSADPRLSGQRYIACAGCHDEGGQDGRTWDFADAGEGLRNTGDMRGRGNMDDGLVHWVANFDEIQDFESALRDVFGGTGLMSDADFNRTRVPIDPNNRKAGLSSDLDALAEFAGTLTSYGVSPFRQQNGALTAAGVRGRAVFEQAECSTCHYGVNFSDSEDGGAHNVGTVDADTGQSFGSPLPNGGIDTPPLKGLWANGPWLHDGSAQTIEAAIRAHNRNMPVSLSGFSNAQMADLANYVRQIDDLEPTVPQGGDGGGGDPVTQVHSFAASIQVDGNMNDWVADALVGNDPDDISGGSNPLDYQSIWMANDAGNLYVRYDNHAPGNTRLTWGYVFSVDIDGPSRGYVGGQNQVPIGVDFLVEGQSVYRYTGNGTNWSWAWVSNFPVQFNGRFAELSVPRTVLGNTGDFDVFFMADNNAVGGSQIDYFPDAASNINAPLATRFFTYEYAASDSGGGNDGGGNDGGSGSTVISNLANNITIDGNLQEWQGLEAFDADPNDVGGTPSIDFLEAWAAHNSGTSLYFAWRNDGPTALSWGNEIFIDTDLDWNTGFRGFTNNSPIGIDYLVEANNVYRYVGNGNSWQWQWRGNIQVATSGSNLEMRIPVNLLDNSQEMEFFFYGDSSALGGNGIDFYPDAANVESAPTDSRRFRYRRSAGNGLSVVDDPLAANRASTGRRAPQGLMADLARDSQVAAGSFGWAGAALMLMALLQRLCRQVAAHRRRRFALGLAVAFTALLAACDSGGGSGVTVGGGNTASLQPRSTLTFANPADREQTTERDLMGGEPQQQAALDANSLAAIQVDILTPKCANCHSGGGVEAPTLLDFTSSTASHGSLVAVDSSEAPGEVLVVPGDAESSYLIDKLRGTQSVGARMPYRGYALSEAEMLRISTWINQGAAR